jgi:hypothetical protein
LSPDRVPDFSCLLPPFVDPSAPSYVTDALVPPGSIPGVLAATADQEAHFAKDTKPVFTEALDRPYIFGIVVEEPM